MALNVLVCCICCDRRTDPKVYANDDHNANPNPNAYLMSSLLPLLQFVVGLNTKFKDSTTRFVRFLPTLTSDRRIFFGIVTKKIVVSARGSGLDRTNLLFCCKAT